MSDYDSLLPFNATDAELAMEQATARIQATPTDLNYLWNPETCPARLLPWLAWALSVDTWSSQWPESVKRDITARSIATHSIKGTVKSVRDTVEQLGANLSLREWWQESPRGEPHTFSLTLLVQPGLPSDAEYLDSIVSAIDRVKPVRSHYTLTAGVTLEGGIGHEAAARTVTYARISNIGA